MHINSKYPINMNYYTGMNNSNNLKVITENTKNNTDYSPAYYLPIFRGEVDKCMKRFYAVNVLTMPRTVREYVESHPESFSMTPLKVQELAFEKLKYVTSFELFKDNINKWFPNEDLFDNLENITHTKATNGILGLYREYKEIYENGPLNSGEDFTIYLLKKIFVESKTIDEINTDLEKDLNIDLKNEFKRRHNDSQYILSSTLKSLGIKMPDLRYLNSLRFTREGYSDAFGLKISEGQRRYWESLTDEQKFEILSKRLEGRDNWWNSLSYDEKLELAAGIESDEELFKNYKKYVSLQKRRKTYGGVGEEGTPLNEVKLTRKKIVIGSKLQQPELFKQWMEQNLNKFYGHLSEADKDIVHMKRVRRLANNWKNLTPAERTEKINKWRTDRQPVKYTMIDAWNHSHNIIIALSEFLREKQILKPVEMLYSDEGFSKFQSSVMTEFWETHPELAEQLGENIKKAYEKVQDSINRGLFKDLMKEIDRDKAYRKNLVKHELSVKNAKQKESEIEKLHNSTDYKKEFTELYKAKIYKDMPLPKTYIDDMTNLLLEKFSKEDVLKYTEALKNNEPTPLEIMEKLKELEVYEDSKKLRYERALEAAISKELLAKGTYTFDHTSDSLIMILTTKMKNLKNNGISKNDKIDLKRIEKNYLEYKKDLPDNELRNYVLNFFIPNNKNNTDIEKLKEFVGTFGRSASILFSEQSSFDLMSKIAFKNKFLYLMPKDLKEKYIFLLGSDKQVKNEELIKQIDKELKKRFNFINPKFLDCYLNEQKRICRFFEDAKEGVGVIYKPESFLDFMGLKRLRIKGEVQNISTPRYTMSEAVKFEFLAMEQAMADELFDACNNKIVYKLSFESLCDLFIQAENLKQVPKTKRKLVVNDMLTNVHNLELSLERFPNTRNIDRNYQNYQKELNAMKEKLDKENRVPDMEDIIFWLNPYEENAERDNIIEERIKFYTLKALS